MSSFALDAGVLGNNFSSKFADAPRSAVIAVKAPAAKVFFADTVATTAAEERGQFAARRSTSVEVSSWLAWTGI
jgi:hypothetical protein